MTYYTEKPLERLEPLDLQAAGRMPYAPTSALPHFYDDILYL